MRDIKFRGIAINPFDGMLYGSLVTQYDSTTERTEYYIQGDGSRAFVDPKTIGQYTGLRDRYDKMIYEGDIVKSKPYMFTGKYIIAQVIFHTQRGVWLVEGIDDTWKETEYLHEVLKTDHETEIIGNIFEHPHLISSL